VVRGVQKVALCDIFTELRFLFSAGGTTVAILAFLSTVLLLVCLLNMHFVLNNVDFPRYGSIFSVKRFLGHSVYVIITMSSTNCTLFFSTGAAACYVTLITQERRPLLQSSQPLKYIFLCDLSTLPSASHGHSAVLHTGIKDPASN
jgi:hypothetical protein